ncbi:MAG: YgcG family protein [Lentisphaerae bacterium]|nr:YgcG family protein [Lentisphaerota bacterium]
MIRRLHIAAITLTAAAAFAEVAVPTLTSRVTDLASALPRDSVLAIENLLADFEAKKGSQVAVLIVRSTAPETIEQYSIRVAEQWKLGRKGVDDGVLLLIAKDDRTMRLEVGYGAEGAIPDAVARRIVDETIAPFFRKGDFAGGVEAGVRRIIASLEGEPFPAPRSTTLPIAVDRHLPMLFVGIPAAGMLMRRFLGRLVAAALGGIGMGVFMWLLSGHPVPGLWFGAFTFVFIVAPDSNRRTFTSGTRGVRSFGSSSFGGGFSGGGGSFGGGGASGRW